MLLRRLYRNATKRVANNDSLSQACEELEAIAHLDGPRIPVYLRLARVNDVIWYDLGDETRRVIRVARDGWSLEGKAPVAFCGRAEWLLYLSRNAEARLMSYDRT